jgi:SAM-dependent methyltransferase
MYKELRNYRSTGKSWANGFFATDIIWLSTFKKLFLKFDPRFFLIKKYIPKGSIILDAGCGMGDWCSCLSDSGYISVGLDFSRAVIDTLKARKPTMDWICNKIQSIPLSNQSLDAIISWGVIEHDESGQGEALREFHRVLKTGGIALISVPIDSDAQRRVSKLVFSNSSASEFFQYFLLPDELKKELEKAGFVLVEPIRVISRHHGIAFPRLYVKSLTLHPIAQRLIGWMLKPCLLFMPSSANMILAVAKSI